MSDKTGIEWTDATWNPVLGCSRTSPGCDNCYAIDQAHRNYAMGSNGYVPPLTVSPDGERTDWTGELRLMPDRLDQPVRWQRPRRVFVNSMSDLFHADVPEGYIGDVWNTMALAPQHQYQLLTKRSKRMRDVMISWQTKRFQFRRSDMVWVGPLHDPLPNVWLGVSVESDKYKFRIEHLRDTPAAVRWLSIEPLVGPLTLTVADLKGIDWVVVGGESGYASRPMHPSWVRGIRDTAIAAGVPFFFKQWGNWAPEGDRNGRRGVVPFDHGDAAPSFEFPPFMDSPEFRRWAREVATYHPAHAIYRHARKKDAGRELDGRTWDQYPDAKAGQ